MILLVSCVSGWNEEDKKADYHRCRQQAIGWSGTVELSKAYCDCVFGYKVLKYADEEDTLVLIDSLGKKDELQESKKDTIP